MFCFVSCSETNDSNYSYCMDFVSNEMSVETRIIQEEFKEDIKTWSDVKQGGFQIDSIRDRHNQSVLIMTDDLFSGKVHQQNMDKFAREIIFSVCTGHNLRRLDYFSNYIDLFKNVNAADTAFLRRIFRQYHCTAQKENSTSMKLLGADILIVDYLQRFNGLKPPCCFCYYKIEPYVFFEKQIFEQNERAFVLITYASKNEENKIRIDGKEMQFPFEFRASKQEGLQVINGEIPVKTKGEQIWLPFETSFLVKNEK